MDMDIEDEIRKGFEEERRQQEREQQQAAEQARQAEERAARAARLRPYLEQYQEEAARGKYGPDEIECTKARIFRSGNKVIYRRARLISRHSGGADNIGQPVVYSLWLDDMTFDLWWQQTGFPARRIRLGENNPDLSPDENRILEEAEKDLGRNLGKRAARNGLKRFNVGA